MVVELGFNQQKWGFNWYFREYDEDHQPHGWHWKVPELLLGDLMEISSHVTRRNFGTAQEAQNIGKT